jgi:hypothetical protein
MSNENELNLDTVIFVYLSAIEFYKRTRKI